MLVSRSEVAGLCDDDEELEHEPPPLVRQGSEDQPSTLRSVVDLFSANPLSADHAALLLSFTGLIAAKRLTSR